MNRPTILARCCAGNQGEVEHDARKEAGLGGAQQEAGRVETRRTPNQRGRGRNQAPGEHDARDPDARPDLLEHQVARHLEEEIADEEDAGAKSEYGAVEAEILVHGERREPDIHAVQKGHEVAKHQQRREPPGDLAGNHPITVVDRVRVGVRHGGSGSTRANRKTFAADGVRLESGFAGA
jgi:hypothetical protein